jgi:hypothetical protein
VPTDFGSYPNSKDGTGQRPPKRTVIPIASGRRGLDEWPPIDAVKARSAVTWPGFWHGRLAGAGPKFVLVIVFLGTLYAGLHHKKSYVTTPQPDQPLRADPTTQSSSAVPSAAKPSPIPAAVAPQSEASVPGRSAKAASSPRGVLAGQYHAVKYEATHKKAFGGCTGQLELTSSKLHFKCSHEADLDIPVTSIASAHKDGVVLASGEKYHFVIANHTKGQAEMIFNLWLNRVRQFEPAGRQSSF